VRFATAAATANPYLLDSDGSSRRAEERALTLLDHALQREASPVPCPHCFLFQENMLPAVRAAEFRRMRFASKVSLNLIPYTLGLGFVIGAIAFEQVGKEAVPTVMGVTASLVLLFFFCGSGLFLARRGKQAKYDPNAEEHANDRRRLASALALKPEEFARLGVPSTRTRPRSRAQLVGQNCVRCGQRIPHDLDSRFCRGCGSSVHDRCAVPVEGGGCPVCGSATESVSR
jgi:hypothetical protein